jgi:hypothetical protein
MNGVEIFLFGVTAPNGPGPPHWPQSVGFLWQAIISSQRPLPDNTQHVQQTNSILPVGFEPTISADERSQTHFLDLATAGPDALEITALKRVVRKSAQFTLRPFRQTWRPRASGALILEKFSSVHNKRTVVKYVLRLILVCGLMQGLQDESSLQYLIPEITGHVFRRFTYSFLCDLYRIPCLWNKRFLQNTNSLNTYLLTAVCSIILPLMLILHDCYHSTIIFSHLASSYNLSYEGSYIVNCLRSFKCLCRLHLAKTMENKNEIRNEIRRSINQAWKLLTNIYFSKFCNVATCNACNWNAVTTLRDSANY